MKLNRHLAQSCILLFAIVFVLLSSNTKTFAADSLNRIDLELIFDRSVPAGTQQQWLRSLKKLGVGGLSLRAARSNEKPEIRRTGRTTARYKVTGIITGSGKIALPGGTFSKNNLAKLSAYLTKVADEGKEGITAARGAFGMTKKQFDQAYKDLGQPIGMDTKDVPLRQMIQELQKQFRNPIAIDAIAQAKISGAKISSNLKPYSAGTALAIALREHHLALRPVVESGMVKHRIIHFDLAAMQKERESKPTVWPIGSKTQQSLRKVAPALMEIVSVEIADYKLSEAMPALQGRVKIPFIYDYAAISDQKIDIEKSIVNFPDKKATYKTILNTILFQAKLKGEVRVDEDGTAFFWITTKTRTKSPPRKRAMFRTSP